MRLRETRRIHFSLTCDQASFRFSIVVQRFDNNVRQNGGELTTKLFFLREFDSKSLRETERERERAPLEMCFLQSLRLFEIVIPMNYVWNDACNIMKIKKREFPQRNKGSDSGIQPCTYFVFYSLSFLSVCHIRSVDINTYTANALRMAFFLLCYSFIKSYARIVS